MSALRLLFMIGASAVIASVIYLVGAWIYVQPVADRTCADIVARDQTDSGDPSLDAPEPSIDQRWLAESQHLYDSRGNNPAAWYGSVELLTEAAKRVRQKGTGPTLPGGGEGMFGINAVYAMLLGYAIECALKGLWVKAGQESRRTANY